MFYIIYKKVAKLTDISLELLVFGERECSLDELASISIECCLDWEG